MAGEAVVDDFHRPPRGVEEVGRAVRPVEPTSSVAKWMDEVRNHRRRSDSDASPMWLDSEERPMGSSSAMGSDAGNLFDLTGRVAVVTGAGGGLGRRFCIALARAGATLVCCDIDGAAAWSTADIVSSVGERSKSFALDVTDEARVAEVASEVLADFGAVDVLVNNAGIGDPNPVRFHEVGTDHWRRVMGVNLDGLFFCSRAFLPAMVARGRGKIVNIASIFGLSGSRIGPIPVYATSKGAVINLTREMASEYATSGIQVNALCPGFVRTGLADGAYANPDFVRALERNVPMGKVPAVDEMNGAMLMLASRASDFMTGQIVVVDGGYNAV